jgi:Putative transposase/Recombinase
VIYDLLFAASAETMLTIAADKKHLGARIGITAVLHTWGSAMTHHPHVHMIVPGGGISRDGSRWIARRPDFFLPVRVLSKLFRRLTIEKRLPIGFVYADGRVRLDPDASVQESVRNLFRTFQRTGSAMATVKAFRDQGLKFPRRVYRGPNKGDVAWNDLNHWRVLWVLHHPRYAGAFCFGRTRTRKYPDGRLASERLAPEQWTAFIRDAHEGYISWEELVCARISEAVLARSAVQ